MTLLHALLICAALLLAAAGAARWLHRRNVSAVERALYSEVVSLRFQAAEFAAEFARRHNEAEPFDEDFLVNWRLSPPMIYPASARDLGLLPRDGLDRLGYFHAQLAEARQRLAEARALGRFASPYRLLSNLVRSCNHIDTWIRHLQAQLGKPVWDDIDLAGANALLEELEDANCAPVAHPWCWADSCSTAAKEGGP